MNTLTETRLSDFTRLDRGEGRDYLGKPNRIITTEWVVKTGDCDDGAYTVVVEVTTSHSKNRKAITSRFGWVTHVATPEGHRITRWSSDNKAINIDTVPVARYSKKALVTVHDDAVSTVLARHDDSNLLDVTLQAIDKGGNRW